MSSARPVAAHTPGPWRKMVNTAGGFGLWSIETDSANVARVADADDADLISLAPDLLAALSNLVSGLDAGTLRLSILDDPAHGGWREGNLDYARLLLSRIGGAS